MKVFDWPAQSPDLNPIENLWSELKKCVRKTGATNLTDLYEFSQEEWKKIPVEYCERLVDSYPARLAGVIKAEGGATKY